MDLPQYEECCREFCDLLRPNRPRVLDVACGPGNLARYLVRQRPDLDLLGIDLAPRMVELAREAVPSARFAVHDCRRLADLHETFDGIVCAFGLPYLSPEEAAAFLDAAAHVLEPDGGLFLSTMLGRSEDGGFEPCSTGDRLYVTYYDEEKVLRMVRGAGFTVVKRWRMASPIGAAKATTDLILIARAASR